MIKRVAIKIFLLVMPLIVFATFLTLLWVLSIPKQVNSVNASYPPPVPNPPGVGKNLFNKAYLPALNSGINWQELQVTVPPVSTSIYVVNFFDNVNNDLLDKAGCEMGTRDFNLPGSQDSFVFIDFGYQIIQNNQWGVMTLGSEIKTLDEVENGVLSYARGYSRCVGSDWSSLITIGIGTNNSAKSVNLNSGIAWANMVKQAGQDINRLGYYNQVAVAGASDIELQFNDPVPTKDWVNGVNSVFYDPLTNYIFYPFFDIGDAQGCSYVGYNKNLLNWGTMCGSADHPDWTASDIFYISTGCIGCSAIPMVYTKNWTNAAQWQGLSDYAVDQMSGRTINFKGVMTQHAACDQRGIIVTDVTCSTPDNSFIKLYSALNTFQTTSVSTNTLRWVTDIKWWPSSYKNQVTK